MVLYDREEEGGRKRVARGVRWEGREGRGRREEGREGGGRGEGIIEHQVISP